MPIGVIVKMPSPSIVELAGHCGFDFVLVDTEHGSGDMYELEHHIRAADSVGIRVFVRVSDRNSADILRALDAGASGIVVPHVTSAEDVAQAAARIHYPPHGRRSLALSTRAGRHGTRPADAHFEEAGNEIRMIVQIEDSEALEALPGILAADGVDGVFIGPADLSASLGLPGQVRHPSVASAIETIVDGVNEHPEIALWALAADEREARGWIERGAQTILFNAPALIAARMGSIAAELMPLPETVSRGSER